MADAWDRLRGELVGVVGLVADVVIDFGYSLDRWSRRHALSRREIAQIERDVQREEPTDGR